MAISEKIKELSDEIKKNAMEGSIKEKTKRGTDIITDTAIMGKKKIENKMEEKKKKLEEERKLIRALEMNVLRDIEVNSTNYPQPLFINKTKEEVVEYCHDFYDTVLKIRNKDSNLSLSFGKKISKKTLEKIEDSIGIKIEDDEVPLVCYYGGSKDFFILSSEGIYFKIKHPNVCEIYSTCIEIDKIKRIEIDNENIFKVNGVSVFKVNKDNSAILKKYVSKISTDNLKYTTNEISDEIEEVIEEGELLRIKKGFSEDEKFIFISKGYKYKKINDWIGCTNKKIIISSSVDRNNLNTVNEIRYNDIDYIEFEAINENIPILNILKECNLEIIFKGSKILVEGLKSETAKRIVDITHKTKEELFLKGNIDSSLNEGNSIIKEDIKEIIKKIEALAGLKEALIISDKEFEIKKKELLDRI